MVLGLLQSPECFGAYKFQGLRFFKQMLYNACIISIFIFGVKWPGPVLDGFREIHLNVPWSVSDATAAGFASLNVNDCKCWFCLCGEAESWGEGQFQSSSD